jgi:hypothetical protein
MKKEETMSNVVENTATVNTTSANAYQFYAGAHIPRIYFKSIRDAALVHGVENLRVFMPALIMNSFVGIGFTSSSGGKDEFTTVECRIKTGVYNRDLIKDNYKIYVEPIDSKYAYEDKYVSDFDSALERESDRFYVLVGETRLRFSVYAPKVRIFKSNGIDNSSYLDRVPGQPKEKLEGGEFVFVGTPDDTRTPFKALFKVVSAKYHRNSLLLEEVTVNDGILGDITVPGSYVKELFIPKIQSDAVPITNFDLHYFEVYRETISKCKGDSEYMISLNPLSEYQPYPSYNSEDYFGKLGSLYVNVAGDNSSFWELSKQIKSEHEKGK